MVRFLFRGIAQAKNAAIGHRADLQLEPMRGKYLPALAGALANALVLDPEACRRRSAYGSVQKACRELVSARKPLIYCRYSDPPPTFTR